MGRSRSTASLFTPASSNHAPRWKPFLQHIPDLVRDHCDRFFAVQPRRSRGIFGVPDLVGADDVLQGKDIADRVRSSFAFSNRCMSTTQPLVTIVINNYNYGRFVSKAIDSALNQSYPAIEIVVVDDGSTDNSPELIGRYAGRVCHIATQNRGQASALSEGIANSHGEMICFLDSDDYFFDNKIEELVRVFQRLYKETSSFLLYHLLEIVNERGEELGDRIPRHIYNVPENLYEYACKYRLFHTLPLRPAVSH